MLNRIRRIGSEDVDWKDEETYSTDQKIHTVYAVARFPHLLLLPEESTASLTWNV